MLAPRDDLSVSCVQGEDLALGVAGLSEEDVAEDFWLQERVREVVCARFGLAALDEAGGFVVGGVGVVEAGGSSETGFFFLQVDAGGGEGVCEVGGVCWFGGRRGHGGGGLGLLLLLLLVLELLLRGGRLRRGILGVLEIGLQRGGGLGERRHCAGGCRGGSAVVVVGGWMDVDLHGDILSSQRE